MSPEHHLTIVDLVLRRVAGHFPLYGTSVPRESSTHYSPKSSTPQDKFAVREDATSERVEYDFLEVRTNAGVTGLFGPIFGEYSIILLGNIRRRVLGLNPLAFEHVLHEASRGHPHGRSGYYRMALGALDCALWDICGKVYGCPVYQLLGGAVRTAIPCYATMLGFNADGENMQEVALGIREQGFHGQKWGLREGPPEGHEGLYRNLSRVTRLRQALGYDHPLMFDVLGEWSSSYTLQFCRDAKSSGITWIEEPLPASKVSALSALRSKCEIPFAAGEHAYTVSEVQELLAGGCVDYLQSDPGWCGISETLKIAALCAAWDIPLIPHGNGLIPALHLAAARPPSVIPLVEYHVTLEPKRQHFFKNQFSPSAGCIKVPSAPGLGIELDDEKFVECCEVREDDIYGGFKRGQSNG